VPQPHRWPIRVYWEDTDAGGVVFYANYLKFFERARTEWLRSLGFSQQALRETSGGMFVVAATAARYRQPARLDDELLIVTNLNKIGKTSASILQTALLKSEQAGLELAVLCEAQIEIAWVDAASFKPVRMPLALHAALNTAASGGIQ
jgi:acyl-CoA thioester hydrolase